MLQGSSSVLVQVSTEDSRTRDVEVRFESAVSFDQRLLLGFRSGRPVSLSHACRHEIASNGASAGGFVSSCASFECFEERFCSLFGTPLSEEQLGT
eukprot:jgi/Pico_ML_1/53512/g4047.t1